MDDDTIHFINRYRREVSEGATTDEAIEQATIHEGRASLTTAIINSVGYAVLFLSEYKPTAWFGGLLALTMAVAFLAEVFILPPIIKLMPRSSARTPFGADALFRHRRGDAGADRFRRLPRRRRRPCAASDGNVSVLATISRIQDQRTSLRFAPGSSLSRRSIRRSDGLSRSLFRGGPRGAVGNSDCSRP